MKRILAILFILTICVNLASAQIKEFIPSHSEIEKMNKAIEEDSMLSRFLSNFEDPESLYYNYKRNLYIADSIWQYDQKTLKNLDIGVTEKLEIIPLVDWFTTHDSLMKESGLSYLIRTDESTILFDLGLNAKKTHPSPLMHNMSKLGISVDDIDIIVISHKHGDHIGGGKWYYKNSFSFTNYQIELKQIPVYTPEEMTYPGLKPIYSPKPTKISKGIATIGVIHKPVFVVNIAEQALAVNVKDKGIVVISGCGHQSMKNIIERTSVLFNEPIFGILGGFHYPMEAKRNISRGHTYLVADKLPWEKLTTNDLSYNIELLKTNGIKVAGISGHDSCDKSIELFKKEFEDNYIDIKVGQTITIN